MERNIVLILIDTCRLSRLCNMTLLHQSVTIDLQSGQLFLTAVSLTDDRLVIGDGLSSPDSCLNVLDVGPSDRHLTSLLLLLATQLSQPANKTPVHHGEVV